MIDLVGQMWSTSKMADILGATEPLSEISFVPDGDGGQIGFSLPAGWNAGLKHEEGTHVTKAEIDVNKNGYALTKDAILQATSMIGLPKEYAIKTPGYLVEQHLEYWYTNMSKELKLLVANDVGVALTKTATSPISNIKLLILAKKAWPSLAPPWVDPLYHHDLRLTHFRVVSEIPNMKSPMDEVWYTGLDIQNSITAEAPLQVRLYLYNPEHGGAISQHGSYGSFSRKGSPSEEVALEWAEMAVENVLTDAAHELIDVFALKKVDVEGEVNHTMKDIFDKYKVPVGARGAVMGTFVDEEDYTMYGVMTAFMRTARSALDFSPQVIRRLMEVAGDLPASAGGRCDSCHRLAVT